MRVEDGETAKLNAGRDLARARLGHLLTSLDPDERDRYWARSKFHIKASTLTRKRWQPWWIVPIRKVRFSRRLNGSPDISPMVRSPVRYRLRKASVAVLLFVSNVASPRLKAYSLLI
jgi:hypothetical protein